MRKDNTSRYKGVRKLASGRWEARLNEQSIAYYATAEEAGFAYDKTAFEQWGEYAKLNHPLEEVLAWTPPERQFGRKSASGYRGVKPCGERWQAELKYNKKRISPGFFDSSEDAAFAYDKAALEMLGDKARLNHALEEVHACIAPERNLRKTNTSGFRGITKIGNSWAATACHIYLGIFDTPEQAARAYDRKTIVIKGDKAILNFPREDYED